MAIGVGLRIPCTTFSTHFPSILRGLLRQPAFPGGHGALHFRFHPHDARAFQFRWYDAAVGAIGVILALLTLHGHIVHGLFRPAAQPAIQLGVGLPSFSCTARQFFYLNGHRRGSLAFQVLAFALALWGVLMGVGQIENPVIVMFGNACRLFGPVPQMLLGIAMVDGAV